jgi:tRNA G46 methylase TrmB
LWGRVDGVKLHAIDANGSAHAGHENRGRQRRRDFRDGSAPVMPPAPPSLRDVFADDTRPLRLDLGCGLGAAARGWASSDSTRNVLGVDASRSLVKACAARASRDKCGANLAYVAADALSILAAAAKYPGPLEAISVQHPTPPNTRGALDWILAPDVVDAARDALAPGGVVAVETRSERAAAAAREGLAEAGFSLVSDAWPLPENARSETGGACVALGWGVERLVFRVP